MPINAYTGLMGSGKSYECVRSVIIPAINLGRRVVTNVDGIDSDAIRAYCHERFGTDMSKLGHVVHCRNEDVGQASFLPYGQSVDTLCQPGDMICIDEAWRFWGADCRPLAEHKIFFREHRHYVHPDTKVCCDLVLMVQDITDLNRILKVVVELSFRTTKIKSLGLNKIYRVEMWADYKQTAKGRVSVENKKYDPAIFPLYSSYSGGAGKELQVDARQNILKSKSLIAISLSLLILGPVALYLAYQFFSSHGGEAPTAMPASAPSIASSAASIVPAASKVTVTGSDQLWRIAGTMEAAGSTYVVLSAVNGALRLEHPSNFQNIGMLMVGDVDGQHVTTWSTPLPEFSISGVGL